MGVGVGDWVGVEGVWGGGREPQLGSWRSGEGGGVNLNSALAQPARLRL